MIKAFAYIEFFHSLFFGVVGLGSFLSFILFEEKETLACTYCHTQLRRVVDILGGKEWTSMTLLKSICFSEKKKESQFAWILISIALYISFTVLFFFCFFVWLFMSLYVCGLSRRHTEKGKGSVDYNFKTSTIEIL